MLGIVALATSQPAQADDLGDAKRLFAEGRTLLEQGKTEEACSKFADSVRTLPSVGPLLNLARCHEQEGKTGTAFTRYRQAAALAEQHGQPERAKTARQLAAKLEPGLSRVTIRLAKQLPDTTILRNGTEVPMDQLGTPIPVDPGEQIIEVSAPGYETWSTTVTVGKNADRQDIDVPALAESAAGQAATKHEDIDWGAESAPSSTKQPAPTKRPRTGPLPPKSPPRAAPVKEAVDTDDGATTVPAIFCLGASGLMLAIGIGFGVHAIDLKGEYDAAPTHALADQGERATTVADASFGVAAVSGLIGVILLLVSNDDGGGEAKKAALPGLTSVARARGGVVGAHWEF